MSQKLVSIKFSQDVFIIQVDGTKETSVKMIKDIPNFGKEPSKPMQSGSLIISSREPFCTSLNVVDYCSIKIAQP